MKQYVQHISGQGRYYQVLSHDSCAWRVLDKGNDMIPSLYLPLNEYQLTHQWVIVPHRMVWIDTEEATQGSKTINPDYVYSGEDCIATLHCCGQYRIKELIIEKLQ